MTAVGLERRFANFKLGAARELPAPYPTDAAAPVLRRGSLVGAERLAATLDGELIRTGRGAFVRLEAPSTLLPVDRERLASLPGQPPANAPLLCLDTETTGLATAAGTLAFLVGLGWWEGPSRFRQIQLLLPDHADEPALLEELARHVPVGGWLVTYNGRGFDWPLIVARYRLARSAPPPHAGHLDLLPIVRRMFRHRMADARLGTVESALLGVRRHADVAGWEIPERYFTFLVDGEPGPLVDVVRHNDEDVRSLARLLVHIDRGYADRDRWDAAPPGDLAGLGRAFARVGRHEEALACVERSLAGLRADRSAADGPAARHRAGELGAPWPSAPTRLEAPRRVADDDPWWSARRRPDFGGRPNRYGRPDSWVTADPLRRDVGWTIARATAERARLLRRLGRHGDAEAAWLELTEAGGTLAVLAWIEVAKAREHRLHDLDGALAAVSLATRTIERQRFLGRPLPRLELAVARRGVRLRRRLARAQARLAPLGPVRAARVARESTAASAGTPDRPRPSTDSDAAAAAIRTAASPRLA
ncbi:MAG: ribonuclease H-like domain-containing protein [Chloroflexi bacterium]|nr:ribonuclease H-like domain-containing protein [Chloroflexota bacterium]